MSKIVITIDVQSDGTIGLPNVDYVGDEPQEPAWAAPLPLPEAPPVMTPVNTASVPSCPQHGPMTFHPAKTKPDGKQVNARYSCDVKVNGTYCPTPPTWLGRAA